MFVLDGLEGVVNQTDDTLVYGKTKAERLALVLKRLEAARATLNRDKCQFAKTTVKFLRHIADGIQPDPDKVNINA